MKKRSVKLFSLLLAACMLLAVLPLAAQAKTFQTGDVFEYGGYPQTLVTDSKTISALNGIARRWNSYRCYDNATGQLDGNNKPGDWMRYADIMYKDAKYRAVTFDYYRPYSTQSPADNPIKPQHSSYQDENGYEPGNVYYFKYETLKWRVLDAAAGLVCCDSAIDAQAFHNTVYYNKNDYQYYQSASSKIYLSNYEYSSIRQWLQKDFYNTAFTAAEQDLIAWTALEESGGKKDKIFLLSAEEAQNDSYGFFNNTRQMTGTDYAKCQNLRVESNGFCSWWLRTPGQNSNGASTVSHNGYVYTTSGNAWLVIYAIVPAFRFVSGIGIATSVNPQGGKGVVCPIVGDPDGDGKLTSADARLALRGSVGLEKYDKNSPEFLAADVDHDGKLTSADARLILRASVGLEKLR